MVDLFTNDEAKTAQDKREQLAREYGTYRAAQEIRINGVLAFAVGYPVPVSHVEKFPALLEADEEGNVPVVKVEEAPVAPPETAAETAADTAADTDTADAKPKATTKAR